MSKQTDSFFQERDHVTLVLHVQHCNLEVFLLRAYRSRQSSRCRLKGQLYTFAAWCYDTADRSRTDDELPTSMLDFQQGHKSAEGDRRVDKR